MDELEMLDLGEAELEEIKCASQSARFPFPTVTVGSECLYFNSAFIKAFGKEKAKIKFYTTPQYVIIAEAKKTDINTFSFSRKGDSYFANVRNPSCLQEKKIPRATYKIYKCKQGFAFNRYEPLEGTIR